MYHSLHETGVSETSYMKVVIRFGKKGKAGSKIHWAIQDLIHEEYPMAIEDREVHQLRIKNIPMAKVLWSNHSAEDCTWETEVIIRVAYPYLSIIDLYLLYLLNSRTNFYKEGRM